MPRRPERAPQLAFGKALGRFVRQLVRAPTRWVLSVFWAIGFVGLMMPHAVRLLGIVRHRLLLPVSVLAGGSFLTLADTCARALWAPQQLPVGIFTALIGVPCMLYLLTRRA